MLFCSFISVISYMGLVYFAAIFLYRSIICRGVVEINKSNCVVGEEEAIWLLKLVLPYLNEFLLKLMALFSGDPSTIMKMAVLLFVLARCGSSITIWKMANLGFFGVFIVPKLCTSYSHQLSAYGIMLLLKTARSFEASLISVGVHGTFFSAMFLTKQTKLLILCSGNFSNSDEVTNGNGG